jgi:hypothetical protein
MSRALLGVVTFIFLMIAVRFFADPGQAVARSDFALESAVARTNARVIGVFPVGCAIASLACLLSAGRLRAGLLFVATMMGLALLVRAYGIFADGTAHESLGLTAVEVVVLTVAAGNLLVQSGGWDRGGVRPVGNALAGVGQ